MSRTITHIINSIPNVENYSFLELGIGNGENHNKINCKKKTSVDLTFNPTFKMSTDEFFKINDSRYDIIYIDACHDIEQVRKDYNNSVNWCNKLIVLHDLYPDTERHVHHDLSSDAYKMLFSFNEINVEYYVLNCDAGLTIVKPPFKAVKHIFNKSYQDLKDFVRFDINQIKHILKFI